MNDTERAPTERPQFKHHCRECRFLGRAMEDGAKVDLYACVRPDSEVLLLARYGDDRHQYSIDSAKYGVDPTRGALQTAYERAVAAGIIVERGAA